MLKEALYIFNKFVGEKMQLIDSDNVNKLLVFTVAEKNNLLRTMKLKGFGLPDLNKVRRIFNTAN